MKLRKPLLWLGTLLGVVVLVVAALAAYVVTRPDEWWRDQLTTTLSQALGRQVEIQGAFHLALGRRLTAEAESIRIANPDWAKSKDMLRVGTLVLECDLLSVLAKTFVIHRLDLTDVEAVLEESQDGQTNWAFAVKTEASPPSTPKSHKAATLPVMVEHVSMRQVTLRAVDLARWEQPLVLQLKAMTGGQRSENEAFVDASGQLGDLPFALKGRVGKLDDVLRGGPISFELSGDLGKTHLASRGMIDSLAAPLQPKLELTYTGPDIARVTQAMGAPKIAEGPFEARIDIRPGGRGVSGKIRAQLGKLQLHADLSAPDLTSAESLDVSAKLTGENLAAFADLVGLPPLPKGSFAIDAVAQRDNGITRIEKMTAGVGEHRVTLDGVIGRWPKLKGTKLAIQAEGPDLAVFTPSVSGIGLGQLPPGAYTVSTVIESDKTGLRVQPSKVTVADYRATAQGHVTTKKTVRAELNVTGAGPDLSMISRLADIIQLPPLPFEASGKIEITGKDITLIGCSGTAGDHRVAADGPIAFSANGPVRLDVKGEGPSLQEVLQGLGYDVIPAAAPYQVEGSVEFADNHVVVTAKQARLGPTEASGSLSIPDLSTPASLAIDVGNARTSDLSTALSLAGVTLELPYVMPATVSGQLKLATEAIEFSKVHGTLQTTRRTAGDTRSEAPEPVGERTGEETEEAKRKRPATAPAEQTIPFMVEGGLAEGKDYTRIDHLQLKLGNIEAQAHGQVGHWETLSGSELSISVQSPDLDTVAAILERPLPAGSIAFDGHLVGTKDALRIDRMTSRVGRSNLSGDLMLTRADPPMLTGEVSSTYLDFGLFHPEIELPTASEAKPDVSEKPNAPAKTEPTAHPEDAPHTDTGGVAGGKEPPKKHKLLFPDKPIELGAFEKLDMDIAVHVDELSSFWQRGVLRDLSAKVVVKGGDLSVTDFAGTDASGATLHGNLAIKDDADLTHLGLDLKGKQLRLGLAAAPGQDLATYPPIDLEARLSGAGNTYHQLAVSLNGRIKAVSGKGQINNSSVNRLLSDVLYELFQALNPASKTEPTTSVNCGVYIFDFAGGIAEIPSFVVQTDRLNIVSAGTVDLNTERINVDFSVRPRKGIGLSASMITNPWIKLGGTLASPAITVNPAGATISTGAAVATGGLSILALGIWDRLLGTQNPCTQALKKDAERQREKAEQESGEPEKDSTKNRKGPLSYD
jgi:uncharacterized protein involved in outer membrane biogenesis